MPKDITQGNRVISAATGGDGTTPLNGTDGNDSLTVASGDPYDRVNGGGGNDIINALASLRSMLINGGDGDDDITGSGNDDTVNAGEGDDTVAGGKGNDLGCSATAVSTSRSSPARPPLMPGNPTRATACAFRAPTASTR